MTTEEKFAELGRVLIRCDCAKCQQAKKILAELQQEIAEQKYIEQKAVEYAAWCEERNKELRALISEAAQVLRDIAFTVPVCTVIAPGVRVVDVKAIFAIKRKAADIHPRLSAEGAGQELCANCHPPIGNDEEQPDARDEEIAQLRKAMESVMIGGNHLASALIHWLGASEKTFPSYKTSIEDAQEIIHDILYWDAWVCWKAIMQARDETRKAKDVV